MLQNKIVLSIFILLLTNLLTACTVPVIVENETSKAIPVVNPHLHEPFATRLVTDIPSGNPGPGKATFIVPKDKRLVIETISILGGIGLDTDIHYASVNVITNGQTMSENITHNIVKKLFDEGSVKGSLVSGSQQTRLYADAGSIVTVIVALTRYPELGNKQTIWISGYLIPINSNTLSP